MSIQVISILAVILDQCSKYFITRNFKIGQSLTVLKDYCYVTYVQNPGAAFGFMADTPSYVRVPFFIVITLGAGLIVYAYQRFIPLEKKLQRFALGLIWGGAMGNFIDRVFYRKVVDFIDLRYHQYQWYVFNIADSCITVGLVLLIYGYLWGKKYHPLERY